MKLDQIKRLGKELSKSQLKTTLGGTELGQENGVRIAHGQCNIGTTFSYTYVPGNTMDINQFINQHYCQGLGISFIIDRAWLE